MGAIVEDIDKLQTQQAEIAARAMEKYYALTSLLDEWEGIHDDANKSTPTLQAIISREVEQQHKDLLSLMRQWQDLQLQIETVVGNELDNLKNRVTKTKEVAEQTTPHQEAESDRDTNNDRGEILGIGA